MKHYRAFALLLLFLAPTWAAAGVEPSGPDVRPEADPGELTQQAQDHRPRIGHLDGRHRIELRFGYASVGGATVRTRTAGVVTSSVGAENLSGGAGYSYWFRPDWAVSLHGSSLDAAVESRIGYGVTNEVSSVACVVIGIRKDFLASAAEARLRPYITAGVGPFIGSSTLERTGRRGVRSEVKTLAAFGGQVGGGLDVQISRLIMLGGRVGYNFMADFSEPIGGRDNYSGIEAGISLSFLFGKGNEPRE